MKYTYYIVANEQSTGSKVARFPPLCSSIPRPFFSPSIKYRLIPQSRLSNHINKNMASEGYRLSSSQGSIEEIPTGINAIHRLHEFKQSIRPLSSNIALIKTYFDPTTLSSHRFIVRRSLKNPTTNNYNNGNSNNRIKNPPFQKGLTRADERRPTL